MICWVRTFTKRYLSFRRGYILWSIRRQFWHLDQFDCRVLGRFDEILKALYKVGKQRSLFSLRRSRELEVYGVDFIVDHGFNFISCNQSIFSSRLWTNPYHQLLSGLPPTSFHRMLRSTIALSFANVALGFSVARQDLKQFFPFKPPTFSVTLALFRSMKARIVR